MDVYKNVLECPILMARLDSIHPNRTFQKECCKRNRVLEKEVDSPLEGGEWRERKFEDALRMAPRQVHLRQNSGTKRIRIV